MSNRCRGLTLVELLVALVISLILVLAATVAYQATRESQRSLDQASTARESGSYALRVIGREVANAAFYPAVRTETADQGNVLIGYSDVVGLPAAYASGIFGCEGATFDPATGACATPVAGAPDSLVIGYFTNDAFGTAAGQRADCTGNDVGGATFNATRVGTGAATLPPAQPLLVANHFALVDTTTTIDGRTVSTHSLACNGNGSASANYVPLLTGIDDLQVSYAVFGDASRAAQRFYNATEVQALGSVTIDGQVYGPWARVIAVRVCVISRTFESKAAVTTDTYQDCDGNQQTGDGSLRRTYTQVFGVRNRQTFTY